MDTRRSQRVADLLLKEVSLLVRDQVKDPRIGFVTFTAAKVSPDLRHARVFFTVFGDEAACAGASKGLASATPYIRREIGQRLRLKVVPELQFVYDSTLDKELRIEELLEEIRHESKEADH